MRLVTKQHKFNDKKEPMYLIYIQNDDYKNIECYEVTGDLNRVVRENELLEDHGINEVQFIDYNTHRLQSGLLNKAYPLILCFYIDRELIGNSEIFLPYWSAVNEAITSKGSNVLAFFMPCDEGEERIECINPIQVEDSDMDKINGLVKDLTKQFQVG